MRRKDREITDRNEIINMLKNFEVCSIAFNDGDYPYVIPLNFGYISDDKGIKLYFHGANEGKKIELIKADNRVAFSLYNVNKIIIDSNAANSTAMYESVCGRGRIRFIEDYNEKMKAFKAIMAKYSKEENFTYNENAVKHTCVYVLEVEHISGKRH